MAERTDQSARPDSPRATAVTAAATAANAHATTPDTHTLHTMQTRVQAALNLGASLDDIRAARATGVAA